jgi:hypothetical protein
MRNMVFGLSDFRSFGSSFVFDRVSNLMVRTISARRLLFDFLIL